MTDVWDSVLEPAKAPSGRLAVDPARAGRAAQFALETVTAPLSAFAKLYERGYEPGTGDTKGVDLALQAGPGALVPGFGRAAGGVGALGGTPPKVTALVSAMRGKPEFEAMADQIYAKLKGVRAETVTPAAKTASGLVDPSSAEGLSLSKLQRQTDTERLGEVAERAAAWRLYEKELGTDFELGAAGGRSAMKPQISEADFQEMHALLKKHPQHADEIRASYGLYSEEPARAVTMQPAQTNSPNLQVLPETPPVREPRIRSQVNRRLDDDGIELMEVLRSEGNSQRQILQALQADGYDIGRSALQKRLKGGYADKPYETTSLLANPQVQQRVLDARRQGASYTQIADDLTLELRKSGQIGPTDRITRGQVTARVHHIRAASELEASGTGVERFAAAQMDPGDITEEGSTGKGRRGGPNPNVLRQLEQMKREREERGQPPVNTKPEPDPNVLKGLRHSPMMHLGANPLLDADPVGNMGRFSRPVRQTVSEHPKDTHTDSAFIHQTRQLTQEVLAAAAAIERDVSDLGWKKSHQERVPTALHDWDYVLHPATSK